MKILFAILVNYFISAHAVYVISHDDSDYVEFGKQFNSVGRFSYDNIEGYASGVLIQTGHPELDGRVVLTVGHNFDKTECKDVLFITDQGSSRGRFYLHPNYKPATEAPESDDEIQTHESDKEPQFIQEHDIAFFLLDNKIDGISLASIDFESILSQDEFKSIINVGYGCEGHLFNTFNVENSLHRRRACYSTLLPENLMNNNLWMQYIKHPESLLIMTSKKHPLMLQENIINGFIAPGDSGGGCFNGRRLFGLNAAMLDDNLGALEKNKTVVRQAYYDQIKEFLDLDHDNENFIVADENQLDQYFQPDLDLLRENNIDINVFPAYGSIIRLSYYKDWILNTLIKFKDL